MLIYTYNTPFCPGVEPEPFEIGEHLIEASGKLWLLDNMLTYLHQGLGCLLVFWLHLVAVQAQSDCSCATLMFLGTLS